LRGGVGGSKKAHFYLPGLCLYFQEVSLDGLVDGVKDGADHRDEEHH